MLLAFLNTRPGAVLLLDEPDAHLHVILQDAIYHELRTVAAQQRSQLIVATHSQVVINAVEPRELLYVMLDKPRAIADNSERNRLIDSLRVLSNADVMQALDARGILYVEGHTDIDILRAWAARLGHRAETLLTTERHVEANGLPNAGSRHLALLESRRSNTLSALQLVRDDLPGLELIDGDAHQDIRGTEHQRRWLAAASLAALRDRELPPASGFARPVRRIHGRRRFRSDARRQHAELLARRVSAGSRRGEPLGDHEFLNGHQGAHAAASAAAGGGRAARPSL